MLSVADHAAVYGFFVAAPVPVTEDPAGMGLPDGGAAGGIAGVLAGAGGWACCVASTAVFSSYWMNHLAMPRKRSAGVSIVSA